MSASTPRVWPMVVLGLGAAALNLFIAAFDVLAVGLGLCSGDGGTPTADPGSTADAFCNGPNVWGYLWLTGLGIGILLPLAGIVWGARTHNPRRFWMLAGSGLALTLTIALAVLNLPTAA